MSDPAPEPFTEGSAGDGPSSATTCGQFPATEVRATYPAEYLPKDGEA